MKLVLDVQRISQHEDIPSDDQLRKWSQAALEEAFNAVELTLRIVDVDEMTALNATYRHKEGPTNVLSFPFEQPADVELGITLLGDIVICTEVVLREAKEQNKTLEAHWAHLVVHGCLHLLGYDHIDDADAEKMETLEVSILTKMGFKNPYAKEDTH